MTSLNLTNVVDASQLLLFLPAAMALNLTPGADMMLCLGKGLQHGSRSAILASLGVSTGLYVHILLAAFGLATLLVEWPVAFEILRWAGVVYLLWLAYTLWNSGKPEREQLSSTGSSLWAAWRDGIFVNVFNPKVAIFVLAFLPPFVNQERGSIVAQFLVFGTILSFGGFIVNSLVGCFADSLGKRLTGNGKAAKTMNRLSAFVFVALATRLATQPR